MMGDDKRQLIRKKLRNGYPQGELREDLTREGFTETEINEAFSRSIPQVTKQQVEYPLSYVLGSGLVISGFSMLLFIPWREIGLLFFLGGLAAFMVGYFLEKEKKKGP